MADPVLGEDFALEVEGTTPGTFIPIENLTGADFNGTRSTNEFVVFGKDDAFSITGKRKGTASASGYLTPSDPGQAILFAAEATNSEVTLKVLYDGVRGYTSKARVSSTKHSPKPDALQDVSWDFTFSGPKTLVGTGSLI
jgi:hypothetical protein